MYEHLYSSKHYFVHRWERAVLAVRPPTPSEGQGEAQEEQTLHPPSGKKTKKQDKDKGGKNSKEAAKEAEQLKAAAAAEKAAKEASILFYDIFSSDEIFYVRISKGYILENVKILVNCLQSEGVDGAEGDTSPEQPMTEEEKKEKRLEDGIGVPHILIDCAVDKDKPASDKVMESEKLPSVEEVLDGLGLGPHGPPIPPPAVFAVVPYAVKRHPPPGAEGGHYMFVASSPDDP